MRLRRVLETDGVMMRIPVVRNVHQMANEFVGRLAQRDTQGMRSMSPLWLHFGRLDGAAALGLLSTPDPLRVGGLDCLAVPAPTAPVDGGLLQVPRDRVTPADVAIDGIL